MQPLEINLNEEVTVGLTEVGFAVYTARIQRILDEYPDAPIKLPSGRVQTMPLWEVMQIFGPLIFHGMKQSPFVGNCIAAATKGR